MDILTSMTFFSVKHQDMLLCVLYLNTIRHNLSHLHLYYSEVPENNYTIRQQWEFPQERVKKLQSWKTG